MSITCPAAFIRAALVARRRESIDKGTLCQFDLQVAGEVPDEGDYTDQFEKEYQCADRDDHSGELTNGIIGIDGNWIEPKILKIKANPTPCGGSTRSKMELAVQGWWYENSRRQRSQ